MRRILLDAKLRTIAQTYADTLFSSRRSDFEMPDYRLSSLLNEYSAAKYVDAIWYILSEYDNIIAADPKTLEAYADESDKRFRHLFVKGKGKKSKASKFSKKVLAAMRYDAVRDDEGIRALSALGLRTCVYCNFQPAITIEKNGRELTAKFELDHFFPKSVYPHLSTAFFNLLPSCSNCNRPKGNVRYHLDEIFYLYSADKSKLDTCDFILDPACVTRYLASGKQEDITVRFESKLVSRNPHKTATEFNNELFCIQGIYDTQLDVVSELIHLHSAYIEAKKRGLVAQFTGLFPDEAILKRMLIGSYLSSDEIHKRPMSKFRQDIAQQLNLIP